MQDDRDLDEAKTDLDTILERILTEYSRNGSVINDEAPRFEGDVQKYFYYALQRSIRCGKNQEEDSPVLRHSPLRPVIRTHELAEGTHQEQPAEHPEPLISGPLGSELQKTWTK